MYVRMYVRTYMCPTAGCLCWRFTLQLEETGTRFNQLSLWSENITEKGGAGESVHNRLGEAENADRSANEGDSAEYTTVKEREPVKGEAFVDEWINIAPEPSAPPLQLDGELEAATTSMNNAPEPSAPPLQMCGEPEAAATLTLPALPPYSAVPPASQQTYSCPQPPPGQYLMGAALHELQAPPPYSPLPPQYAQQSHPGPLQAVRAQENVQKQGGLHDFLCAVCKHKSMYRQSPGQRIAHVRCPKCKECTVCYAKLCKESLHISTNAIAACKCISDWCTSLVSRHSSGGGKNAW